MGPFVQRMLALMVISQHAGKIREKTPMSDFFAQHAFELGSFVAGLITGGAAGSVITLRVIGRHQSATGHASITDQHRSVAGGDIVGRDKNTR